MFWGIGKNTKGSFQKYKNAKQYVEGTKNSFLSRPKARSQKLDQTGTSGSMIRHQIHLLSKLPMVRLERCSAEQTTG